ncbi:MAG: serine/threonine protein kinase [Deltaproteobacteria bacterium]|nr:serine/threonine protein kinase [Deltaproteobacteria bacterium]
MGSPQDTSGRPAKGRTLSQGDSIADRFTIEQFAGPEIVGESYLATDTKNDRPVSIHVLPANALQGPNALERVKSEMRSASQLTHKNIVTTFGMGQLSAGAVYIIGEHVEGSRLDELMSERRKRGETFSLRGAYSLVAHLSNALAFAHKTRIHGSLSPQAVVVSSSGRVKIRDFPMSRLLYLIPGFRKSVPAYVRRFWAPEIGTAASVITNRADVYSLGVIFFELLTGQTPADAQARVSQQRTGLPAALDEMVARCLDAEPANRYKNVVDFKEDLATLLESEGVDPRDEALTGGLDIEIDVDRPLSTPPPPAEGLPAAPVMPPPAPGPPPPGPSSPGLPPLPPPPVVDEDRPSLGPLNLDSIMASVQDQDAEKWMISKGKMDHGPFRTREVVQMIVRWEVEGQHMIQDIETGIRIKLRESEEFKDMIERARVTKVKHEEQMALEQSEKSEKRSGVAKIFVVLLVVGGIGLIVGSIFAGRAIYKAATEEDEQDIDDLIASGELKIDIGQGGIVKDKKGRKGKRKGGGGGGGGGGGSYDDYMNQAVNLGDLAGDGGQMQLSQGQINQVMSSKGKAVYPCIYGELKRNKALKKVSLKFAIEGGTGSVKGVTVTSGGSQEFQKCVTSKMKKVKFPKFSAPRMGATFYFNVG